MRISFLSDIRLDSEMQKIWGMYFVVTGNHQELMMWSLYLSYQALESTLSRVGLLLKRVSEDVWNAHKTVQILNQRRAMKTKLSYVISSRRICSTKNISTRERVASRN